MGGRHLEIRAGLLMLAFGLVVTMWIGPGQILRAGQTVINKMVILTMVLEKIDRFYVEERDPNQLVDQAIIGIVADLDPHSSYLPTEEFISWKKKSQAYLGVGLNYQLQPEYLVVTSVHPQGPAAEKGLRSGDHIVRVEGKKVEFLTADDLEKILQNDSRLTVKLQIVRDGLGEPLDVELTKRYLVPTSVIAAFMITDSVGYIKVARFTEFTPADLDAAMIKLQSHSLHYLLLDLRDNPGGIFTAAVESADRFLPAGRLIVSTRGRTADASLQYTAGNGKKYPPLPLIVLVNETSASDTEILAGAIQDWDRGLIVGQPTFGKGSVQTEYSFQDGSGLLLTTALYFTPLGRSIQKQKGEAAVAKSYRTPSGRTVQGGSGLCPDVLVEPDQPMVSEALKKVLSAPENPLLRFVERSLPVHDQQDLSSFYRQYQVSEVLLQSFYQKMKHSGYAFSSRDRQQSNTLVRFILKREIAGCLWGEEGRVLVTTFADSQVLASLPLFKQAGTLSLR